MRKIRKLCFFDKKDSEEMISFLNNTVSDNYITHIMFNPFNIFHHLLPLSLKFLPETFVLTENKKLKGLITVSPTRSKLRRVEIQKLFFEENAFEIASELVQFAVSKYKAMGAFSVLVKVDDYLPELLSVLISKCGFSQISYEKLWRINKAVDTNFDKKYFRHFKNSDAKILTEIYNNSLLPHFRPLLSKNNDEFKEPFFRGLTYFEEYKYIIQNPQTLEALGFIIIRTFDNENYVVDIIKNDWAKIDINTVLSYATYQIKKRKKRFGLFVRTKRYLASGESFETQMIESGHDCVQNQIVLTNSSAKVLKENIKTGNFTIISDFYPTKPIATQKICNKM